MPCLPKKTTREKNSSKIDLPSLISFHITLTHFSLIILFNFIVLYVISMSSFFAWWKLLRRHTPKLLWILSSTTCVNWFTLTFVVVHMYSAVFQFCNDSYIFRDFRHFCVWCTRSDDCKYLFFGGYFKHRYCQELLRIKVFNYIFWGTNEIKYYHKGFISIVI